MVCFDVSPDQPSGMPTIYCGVVRLGLPKTNMEVE